MVAPIRRLLCLAMVMMAPAVSAEAEQAAREPAKTATATELLLVPDSEPWLVSAVCPVLARLHAGDRWPLLLVVGKTPGAATHDFLGDLRPQRTLLLTSDATDDPLPKLPKQTKRLAAKPLRATRDLAAEYWGRPARIVATRTDDPERLILASALAARRAEPLLIYERGDGLAGLLAAARELGATRLVIVGVQRELSPSDQGTKLAVEWLSCREITDRLVQEPGPAAVRTLVVARVPESEPGVGRTAWLAPYFSAVRGAPVLLVRSGKAVTLEKDVEELIARHRLKPRTITLLGDYESLRIHKVDTEVPRRESGRPGLVTVEPCMPTGMETTALVGVGRIPLSALDDASLLVARGFARPRLLSARRPDLLMLANAATEQWQLPLCEVVSRLTAAEFRNCGVETREFYRVETNQPEVLAAAGTAQVIVFQGHTEHQLLVGKRSTLANGTPEAAGTLPHWSGVPVVFLQTCESLRRESFRQLHELGGVAMFGTGSPIHSASGSGFMKAMADSVLYRRSTLGEALRDARNYFACLMDLKNTRGHNEQAKTRRTAISFRLWGDPELELFPQGLPGPMLAPLAAEWAGADRLQVRAAPRSFEEVRNEEYRARIQPGTELAGMVSKGTTGVRRVLGMYFFRLPLAEGFVPDRYAAWSRQGDDGERGVFRVDPRGRLLYVLYFPEPNAAPRSFALQGVRRPPLEKPPGQ